VEDQVALYRNFARKLLPAPLADGFQNATLHCCHIREGDLLDAVSERRVDIS
jgi:hypothetical protein